MDSPHDQQQSALLSRIIANVVRNILFLIIYSYVTNIINWKSKLNHNIGQLNKKIGVNNPSFFEVILLIRL